MMASLVRAARLTRRRGAELVAAGARREGWDSNCNVVMISSSTGVPAGCLLAWHPMHADGLLKIERLNRRSPKERRQSTKPHRATAAGADRALPRAGSAGQSWLHTFAGG